MQQIDKIIQTISMCKRASLLIMGFDVVKKSMQDGSAELIIVASDLSPKTLKEVIYLSSQFEIEVLTIKQTLDELWYILGKRAGVLSITDHKLSQKILAEAKIQQQEEN